MKTFNISKLLIFTLLIALCSVAEAQTGKKPTSRPQKGKAAKVEQDTWDYSDTRITSVRSPAPIDPRKLYDEAWLTAPATTISLMSQNFVYPPTGTASVSDILVRSLYFENTIAIMVEWKDATKNVEVDVDQFCDQVAVMLPVTTSNIPSFMMGNPSGRCHIVHWKAIWQEDCEHGFRDVQDAYPNMWVDVYPGMEGELDRSKRVYASDITSEHIVDVRSTQFMPGTYARNPMSQIRRKEPVEEASAEGFGTLTTQPNQQARAWAEWRGGQWRVCVLFPVNSNDAYRASLKDKTKVAFAVWNGADENIGGRKHVTDWADIILAP